MIGLEVIGNVFINYSLHNLIIISYQDCRISCLLKHWSIVFEQELAWLLQDENNLNRYKLTEIKLKPELGLWERNGIPIPDNCDVIYISFGYKFGAKNTINSRLWALKL